MNHRKLFFNLIVLFTLPLASLLGSLVLTGLAQAAPVAATGIEGAKLTFPETSPATIPLLQGSPILTITKIAEPDPVDAGSVLAYTISVVNGSATATATDVIITDTLDSNVNFASASDGGQPSAGFVTWNVGVITTGATITRTLLVTVGDVMSGTILSNTAVVTSTEGISDSETITTTVTTAADLVISKNDSPDPVLVGNPLTYTLTITNAGPSNATGVVVTDTLPLTVSFSSASGGCSESSGVVVCNIGNLTSGATGTVTIVVTPTATGILTNTAVISSTTTDPDNSNNSVTAVTTVNPKADLSITKTNAQTSTIPGTSTAYSIVVSNSGPSNAPNATVTDNFPAGLTGVIWTCTGSGGGNCTASGSSNINDATVDLPPGSSVMYVATGTVSASVTGSLTNTATVTATGGVTDPDPSNNSDTDTDTLTPQANLSITKTNSQSQTVPGTNTTYTIVISNSGPSNAPTTLVTDDFPSASSVNWTCTGSGGGTCPGSGSGNISATVDLPAGGSATFIATIAVNPGARGNLVNTATVTALGGVTDPNTSNNSATDTDTLTPEADLRVIKSDSPGTVTAGNALTYTLDVTNFGPSDATGVTLTDNLPAGVTFLSSTPGSPTCNPVSGSVICNLDTIADGGNTVVTIQVRVNSSTLVASISNSAEVDGIELDPFGSNDSDTEPTIIEVRPDLTISKLESADPTPLGMPLTYTLRITNNGPSDAPGVVVTDTLPGGPTLGSVTTSQGTCTGTSTIVCNLGGMVNGATAIVTITVNPLLTGTLNNTATVGVAGSDVVDPTPGNDSSSTSTAVNIVTDLAITNVDSPDPVIQGNTLTYNLTVTNNGPSNATGVSVTDTLPAGVTFSSTLTSQGSCGGTTTITCNLGSLAKNASATITITVNVNPSTSGNISSTATVSGGGGLDNPPNNSATATTLVTILYKTYLPVVLKDFPVTDLSVFNDNTGGNVIFTVLGTSVSCTVPDNTLQFCGSFPSGTYNVKVNSACPNGGSATFSKTYAGGPQTTNVFCN